MASLNKVLLIGNLTRDPELRYLTGGNSAVCEFGIAINRRFMQASGQEKDETCFLEIVVWGKQAETCSRFLQKGSTVFIEGRLVYDQWTEKDTQKKRSRVRVTAERVQFLSGRRDDQGGLVRLKDVASAARSASGRLSAGRLPAAGRLSEPRSAGAALPPPAVRGTAVQPGPEHAAEPRRHGGLRPGPARKRGRHPLLIQTQPFNKRDPIWQCNRKDATQSVAPTKRRSADSARIT